MRFLSSRYLAYFIKSIIKNEDGGYMNNDSLKIMDLNSFEIVKTFGVRSKEAICLNFNSEKNVLYAGSHDGSIRKFGF